LGLPVGDGEEPERARVMMANRPDRWSTARWNIARLIIVVDLLMALGPGFVVYELVTGGSSQITDDNVILAAWGVAMVPLVASFVLALRVFKAGDKGTGWRATAWAMGLFLAGLLIIGVISAIRDNH
jgi:hypothetical protein